MDNKNNIYQTIENFDNQNKNIYHIDQDNYQIPTTNNPFMNVTAGDLIDNQNRLPVQKDLDKNILDNIDYVLGDSKRQFYTMPDTTIPNDQMNFAKWLYDHPETCKENQLNCLRYEDVRFNRSETSR